MGQSGIQLYNFSGLPERWFWGDLVSRRRRDRATPNCSPPVPANTATARMERLFAWLQAKDIRNVELYGYPGNPFPTTQPAGQPRRVRWRCARWVTSTASASRPATAASARALGHEIAAREILGQDHIGESGAPPARTARQPTRRPCRPRPQLNKLGKRSVEAGVGPGVLPQPQRRVQHARSLPQRDGRSRARGRS